MDRKLLHPRLWSRRFRLGAVLGTVLAVALGSVVLPPTGVAGAVQQVSGQVSGNIEIDARTGNALYPEAAQTCTALSSYTGTSIDWVKDCAANADLTTGTGHWNGFRYLDYVPGQQDADIFLTGGKENDTTTWNPGPGSAGSAKYDVTQAYLANNQTYLYFGAHRLGNDGTTAVDLEANQNAPASTTDYIPTRTIGDKLFTFEMQGSGNESGSVAIHTFSWDGDSYEPITVTGLDAQMNGDISSQGGIQTAPVPPWGTFGKRGLQTTGDLQLREFMEARVPLSALGVSACGDTAYMQIRSRSSAEAGSDLKDTTKIFEYSFANPTLSLAKSVTTANAAAGAVTVTATPSGFPSGTTPTYEWRVKATGASGNGTVISGQTGATLTYSAFETDDTAAAVSFALTAANGGADAAGSYSGRLWSVDISATASGGGCSSNTPSVTAKKVSAVDP